MNTATREALLRHRQFLGRELERHRDIATDLRDRLAGVEKSIAANEAELAEIEADLDKENASGSDLWRLGRGGMVKLRG